MRSVYSRRLRGSHRSFALVVKFDLENEEKAAAFDALVAETVRAVTDHEPGTLVYATHTVADQPLAVGLVTAAPARMHP